MSDIISFKAKQPIPDDNSIARDFIEKININDSYALFYQQPMDNLTKINIERGKFELAYYRLKESLLYTFDNDSPDKLASLTASIKSIEKSLPVGAMVGMVFELKAPMDTVRGHSEDIWTLTLFKNDHGFLIRDLIHNGLRCVVRT